MVPAKLREDVRPLSDLKAGTAKVIRQVNDTHRPVIFTRHGRGVAVMMSVEAFEELQHDAARARLQRAIEDAERDVAAGRHVAHSKVASRLKRWASGSR